MTFPFLPRVRQHGCGDPGHEIPFACLFDGAQYLTRTPAASGNAKKWSFSVEIKRAALGSGLQHGILSASPVSNYGTGIKFAGDAIQFYHLVNGTTTWVVSTTALFRDPAATLNLVVDYDSAAAAAIDRVKIQVNGVLQTLGGSFPSQNFETYINTAVAHHVGADRLGTLPFNGYLSAFHFLDGITADPTAFGYVNRFGVWVPKNYTGVYGAQGWHLDFADPLALGNDVSGNGNHFATSGLTSANQVTDTPTHGFATLNPLAPSGFTLSKGNLTATTSGTSTTAVSTLVLPASGKWYFEATLNTFAATTGMSVECGLYPAGLSTSPSVPINTVGYCYNANYTGTARKIGKGVATAYGVFFNLGAVISVVFDASAGTLEFWKDGVSQGVAFTGITELMRFAVGNGGSAGAAAWTVNFGQRPFAYAPPAGFKALSTPNLPCPAIKTPDSYFTTRLASAGASVADLPWNPTQVKTLIVSKRRDSTADWRVNDTLRPGRAWSTNTGTADFAEVDGLTFTGTGYNIGANAAYAGSRVDYCFRAAPAAGFDMRLVDHVNGVADVVPHAVGGVVEFAWVVPLGGGSRRVYHKGLSAGQYLLLNSDAVAASDAGWFASSDIDVTLGASLATGQYALYLWRSIPQFSSFGTYTGNGAADGAFVPLGFSPQLYLSRVTTGVISNFIALDVKRSPINPITLELQLNVNTAERSAYLNLYADIVSNGLKARGSRGDLNQSGGAMVYAAWAETPVKFAHAR